MSKMGLGCNRSNDHTLHTESSGFNPCGSQSWLRVLLSCMDDCKVCPLIRLCVHTRVCEREREPLPRVDGCYKRCCISQFSQKSHLHFYIDKEDIFFMGLTITAAFLWARLCTLNIYLIENQQVDFPPSSLLWGSLSCAKKESQPHMYTLWQCFIS